MRWAFEKPATLPDGWIDRRNRFALTQDWRWCAT
jgi:hypothetical protein